LAAGHDGAIWTHHPLVALGRRLGGTGIRLTTGHHLKVTTLLLPVGHLLHRVGLQFRVLHLAIAQWCRWCGLKLFVGAIHLLGGLLFLQLRLLHSIDKGSSGGGCGGSCGAVATSIVGGVVGGCGGAFRIVAYCAGVFFVI